MPRTNGGPRPALPANHAAIIDELGRVDAEMAVYDQLAARQKELRGIVMSWFAEFPAGAASTIDGEDFAVSVTARRNERRIVSMARLFKAIGQRIFLGHCKFSLGDAERLLSPTQRAQLIEESQSGPRSLSIAPRALGRKAS